MLVYVLSIRGQPFCSISDMPLLLWPRTRRTLEWGIPHSEWRARVRGIFCKIDDKHVPLYRVLWIADVPHFCGAEECLVEGKYEVRLEADESVFGTREERDSVIASVEAWHRGGAEGESDDDTEWA